MARIPEKQGQSDPPLAAVNDPIAEELARRIGALVPAAQRAQVIAQVVSVVQQERFDGPIAHPRHLREYDQIVPGSADRIILMAEGALAHSQKLQDRALDADISDQREGRRLGFVALLLLIVAALVCGLTGHDALAAGFIGAGALGVVGSFIKGRGGGG